MAVIEQQTQLENRVGGKKMPAFTRHDFKMAMIVTRREVRDSFRDWRIIIPILVLTLFFPALMNYTASRLLNFVNQYNAEIIATRLIPFLLLVVGFFPMSFSLVIALETFVGEKERKSLEPLLATPLTNTQLYLGKIVAAIVPPLCAAYLGIAVYLVGLAITVQWTPTWELLVQALLITTFQGIVMVAGAVVISSQTTSVRASNLLASFIIVPMALLIQSEAVALFFANYTGLWWIIAGMIVTSIILVRMGVHMFNREELLGRSIDHIRFLPLLKMFWWRFTGRTVGKYPSPVTWFRGTLKLLPALRTPMIALLLMAVVAWIVGAQMARLHVFPESLQAQLAPDVWQENLSELPLLSSALPVPIIFQNLRVVALEILVGIFTFGVLAVIIFMLPWVFLGFLAAQFTLAGESATLFMLATVVPHALVELPALILISAAAFRWHILLIAPPPNRTISESWMEAAADFFRVLFGLGIPLLIAAAFVEGWLTPQVLYWFYG